MRIALKLHLKLQLACGLFLFSTACSPLKNSQYEQYSTLVAEAPECSENYTYTSSTTISGTATFFKRGINLVLESTNLKNMTLGDPLVDPLPIRYAEIAVYNSKNQLVQCGITNDTGHLKGLDGVADLVIPAIADYYSIRVLARMNINLTAPGAFPAKPTFAAHVAVKQDIYTNEVHFIKTSIYSNGVDAVTNANLVAYARQTDSMKVEGGAFNILNSILTAYQYIQNNTSAVDTTCLSPKLNVYWKLGFNPFQYSDPAADPSYIANGSYYNKSEENLYITGGRLGDISIDVTNHFDDYVIIHELGHHIENKCGQLLSPGGTHAMLARIDPRLAWSEGWSNFLAAQVMYDANSIAKINPEIGPKLLASGFSNKWTYFFGSRGFSDSVQNVGNGTGFMFDLKKAGNNPDTWQYGPYQGTPFDKVDPPRYPGEGHFREGAITRGLFKLANNCGGTCTTSTPIAFTNFWMSMDKLTGIGQAIYPFKSSHTFMEKLKSLVTPATWTANYIAFNQSNTSEALHLFSDGIYTSGGITRWIPYGTYLTTLTAGACSTGQMYIEPRSDDPVLTSTNSDQRYSNHFYTIDLNVLAGVDEINVTFAKQNVNGTSTELDILLLQENYYFNGDYTCSVYASDGQCSVTIPTRTTSTDVVRSDRRAGAIATKTIKNLQALDKTKRYILNIRAYTANKTIASVTDYSYTITNQAGLNLCP